MTVADSYYKKLKHFLAGCCNAYRRHSYFTILYVLSNQLFFLFLSSETLPFKDKKTKLKIEDRKGMVTQEVDKFVLSCWLSFIQA